MREKKNGQVSGFKAAISSLREVVSSKNLDLANPRECIITLRHALMDVQGLCRATRPGTPEAYALKKHGGFESSCVEEGRVVGTLGQVPQVAATDCPARAPHPSKQPQIEKSAGLESKLFEKQFDNDITMTDATGVLYCVLASGLGSFLNIR